MTTNVSIDEIKAQLDNAQNKDINIDIDYKINTSVDFLDVTVENKNGYLTTSVFHKPSAEPYVLPYTSDHPHHIHQNIPYAALLRIARICSNVHDFDMERIRTDLSLLLNNYPPEYISKHFHRFFVINNAMPVLKHLDTQTYYQLHQKLLHQPSRREKQLITMIQDNETVPTALQIKPWDIKVMYPRFQFENGPIRYLKPSFLQWWKKWYIFPQSSVADVEVRTCTTMNRTLENLFIHKKSPKDLLRKLE
jgi:hypothetical protein